MPVCWIALASFPGFPSSFPSLTVREKRTASDGKLEGKPGNEARIALLIIMLGFRSSLPIPIAVSNKKQPSWLAIKALLTSYRGQTFLWPLLVPILSQV